MVCTSTDGDKVPLAVVGKAKRPVCFKLCGNTVPLSYTNQRNAWFDRYITMWWLEIVFWPSRVKRMVKYMLYYYLITVQLVMWIKIKLSLKLNLFFLPPNITNTHQPADMATIHNLKVSYKTVILQHVLSIFYVERVYEKACLERERNKNVVGNV